LVFGVKNEAEELAQYMRRDCLEVAGVKPNGEYNSEDIVKNIGEILNVDIDEKDISIAHPLRSFNKDALPKTNPQVKSFLVGNNIYISESLIPQRKKLYGDVNRLRKKLNWKFIWTHYGRIYIRKNESATELYVFNTSNDLTRPQSLVV
jgi:hypothetical protein